MADVFAHKKSLNNLSRAKRSVPGITPSILQSIEMGTDSVSHKKQYSIMDNKKFLNLIAAPSPLTNSLSHSKITHNRDSSGDSKLIRPQSRLRLGGPGEKSAVLLDSKLSRPQSQLKIRTPTPVDREKIVSLKGVNTSHMARRPEDIPKMMMHQKKLSEGRNSVSKSRIEVSTPQEEPPKPRLTLKKSIVGAVQTLTKKHVIAQKIVKEYEEEDKSSAQVSEVKNKIQFQEDFFQPHKKKRTSEFIAKVELNLSLTIVLEALENAIAEARDRTALYKHMERAAEAAFCSKNGELYMAVLKTQAKILLAYNDIYKGISVFKILKKVGETKKDYMTKLISYKYIGRCFQMMGNHAMAIFYYTKLLQMAWYCNKNPYELRAYDLIGIQYFYLGDLERAKFYHNKMTDGRAESKDSDLRKLGISKLLNKMTEFAQPKKESLVTPIEFELGGRYPLSEDDFELPPPDNQSRNKENREIMNEIFGVREKSPPKKDLGEFRRIVVRRKLDHDRGKPKKGMIRARVGVQEQSTEYILQEEDKEVLDETGKKHLFLSHLSPNRLVKNFNSKDTKDVIRDYMTNGNGKDGNMIGLDGKALEGVKNKIMKLKNAIVLALQRVVEIESRSKGL